MNSIRPRRARLLGTLTLILGLMASTIGLVAPPAGAAEPVLVVQHLVQCQPQWGDGYVSVEASVWNHSDADQHLVFAHGPLSGPFSIPAATDAGPGQNAIHSGWMYYGPTVTLSLTDPVTGQYVWGPVSEPNPCLEPGGDGEQAPGGNEDSGEEPSEPPVSPGSDPVSGLTFEPVIACTPWMKAGYVHLEVMITNVGPDERELDLRVNGFGPLIRVPGATQAGAGTALGHSGGVWPGATHSIEIVDRDTDELLFGPVELDNPCLSDPQGGNVPPLVFEPLTFEFSLECATVDPDKPRLRWNRQITNPNRFEIPVVVKVAGSVPNTSSYWAATEDGPAVIPGSTETWVPASGIASYEVLLHRTGEVLFSSTLPDPCVEDGDDPIESIPPTFDWEVVCLAGGVAEWRVTWFNEDPATSYQVRAGSAGDTHLWADAVLPSAEEKEAPGTVVTAIEVPAAAGVVQDAYLSVDGVQVIGKVDLAFDCTPEPGGEEVPGGDTPEDDGEPELPASSTTTGDAPEVPTPTVADPVPAESEPGVLASVEAAVPAPQSTGGADAGGVLPRTGSSTFALLVLGLAMSLAGALLLVAGGRREVV
jgi:LPXTG-motif cell wall-anchored protein